jgi:hypothetical protein
MIPHAHDIVQELGHTHDHGEYTRIILYYSYDRESSQPSKITMSYDRNYLSRTYQRECKVYNID